MSARDEVLARVRQAHATAPPPDLTYDAVERTYRTTSDMDGMALVERLVDRLLDYKALVRQSRPDGVAATIATALADRGVRSVAVPADLESGWLAALGDVAVLRDEGQLTVADLDAVDGVLTGCAVAVAETGTLVLDGSAGQGRRVVSLIPDYHLCVVHVDQVVADVPQLVAAVDLTRPVTLISGPSATSDIELNRVEGVHGPRTLEVVLVGAEPGSVGA